MNELKLKKMVYAIAYFAIIFLAIALLLKQISSAGSVLGDIASILTTLANTVAYALTAFTAFFYVKTKRNLLYMVSYIVAVILVVIFVIIPLF